MLTFLGEAWTGPGNCCVIQQFKYTFPGRKRNDVTVTNISIGDVKSDFQISIFPSVRLFIWFGIPSTFGLAQQENLFLLRSNHLLVLAHLREIGGYFCCGILSFCKSSATIDLFWILIFRTNWDVHQVDKISHVPLNQIKRSLTPSFK